jgi:predicted transcriptional regulator
VSAETENGHRDTLTPAHAAELLGVSPRTVRRWIERGQLEGSIRPCTTTRAAVDAYLSQRRPRSGHVLTASAAGVTPAVTDDNPDAERALAIVTSALRAGLRRTEELARENGRLEMQVDYLRRQVAALERERGKGQGMSTLSRVRRWLLI